MKIKKSFGGRLWNKVLTSSAVKTPRQIRRLHNKVQMKRRKRRAAV